MTLFPYTTLFRSEALFYYFRLEDQIPETHLLRLIEKHITFAFVPEQLKDRYGCAKHQAIGPLQKSFLSEPRSSLRIK